MSESDHHRKLISCRNPRHQLSVCSLPLSLPSCLLPYVWNTHTHTQSTDMVKPHISWGMCNTMLGHVLVLSVRRHKGFSPALQITLKKTDGSGLYSVRTPISRKEDIIGSPHWRGLFSRRHYLIGCLWTRSLSEFVFEPSVSKSPFKEYMGSVNWAQPFNNDECVGPQCKISNSASQHWERSHLELTFIWAVHWYQWGVRI